MRPIRSTAAASSTGGSPAGSSRSVGQSAWSRPVTHPRCATNATPVRPSRSSRWPASGRRGTSCHPYRATPRRRAAACDKRREGGATQAGRRGRRYALTWRGWRARSVGQVVGNIGSRVLELIPGLALVGRSWALVDQRLCITKAELQTARVTFIDSIGEKPSARSWARTLSQSRSASAARRVGVSFAHGRLSSSRIVMSTLRPGARPDSRVPVIRSSAKPSSWACAATSRPQPISVPSGTASRPASRG